MQQPKTVAIIGTGMIASSMAVLCAGHGRRACVLSRSEASAARCLESIRAAFRQMEDQSLLTHAQTEICETYIRFTGDYADLAEAEIAFECIVEDIDKKHEVYRALEQNCPALRAICSVSSSIVPNILAEGMEKYGDRIIVTHPFNPAHMVPYFELCAADATAEGVVEYVMSVLSALGRKPVLLKKPTPGFIGNRLQFALLREAISLVESGVADPRDVDACLQYSFCPRYTSIGIFEHFDNGGLELCSTVCANLFPILSDEKTVPAMMRELMDRGDLGVKTGKGFYDWHDTDMDAYAARVSEPYWKFCLWDYPDTPDSDE